MKKIIIAALLLTGVTLKAQHDISVDVLGFAFSKYGLGYEYALNPNNSVGMNINFSSKNMFDDGKSNYAPYAFLDGEYDYSEMNIVPEYKAFFTPNKGNDGVYAGIYAKFRTSKASDNTYSDTTGFASTGIVTYGKTDVSTSGLALGVMGGYKWKTSGALFLELTAGVGKFLMNNVNYSDSKAEKDPNFNEDDYVPYIGNSLAVDVRINLKVGIRIGSAK